jgi:hypothetical protein
MKLYLFFIFVILILNVVWSHLCQTQTPQVSTTILKLVITRTLWVLQRHVVATLALACDQGNGVARCGPNSRPGSAIVWKENSKCQWGHWPLLLVGESVATLAFGLRLRQGGWEVAGLEVDPRVTSHAPRSAKSAKSVREWTLTLPSELPCWVLVRVGVPKGFLKLQKAFWGVKTPWLVALLISMESSWSVDV